MTFIAKYTDEGMLLSWEWIKKHIADSDLPETLRYIVEHERNYLILREQAKRQREEFIAKNHIGFPYNTSDVTRHTEALRRYQWKTPEGFGLTKDILAGAMRGVVERAKQEQAKQPRKVARSKRKTWR